MARGILWKDEKEVLRAKGVISLRYFPHTLLLNDRWMMTSIPRANHMLPAWTYLGNKAAIYGWKYPGEPDHEFDREDVEFRIIGQDKTLEGWFEVVWWVEDHIKERVKDQEKAEEIAQKGLARLYG